MNANRFKSLTVKTDSQKLNMYAQPRKLDLTTLATVPLLPTPFLLVGNNSHFLLS